jgi:glycosyltransferase involved in cell wall biosynthesis
MTTVRTVVIVCPGFNESSILRQPWHQVQVLSKEMMRRGIAVTVISSGNVPGVRHVDGVKVRFIPHLILIPILRRNTFMRVLLSDEPDVVLWYGSPLAAFYMPFVKRIGKPIVLNINRDRCDLACIRRLSFREIVSHRSGWDYFASLLAPASVLRRLLDRSPVERVVVPTSHLKESLCRIGIPAERIEVASSFVDLDSLAEPVPAGRHEALRQELGFHPQDFVVTYFGSPCTLRGTDTIVKSIPLVLSRFESVKFLLLARVSENEDEWLTHAREGDYLRKLVDQSDIKANVRIVDGILERNQLRDYLNISSAIVLPFKILLDESPLSVLEAMSIGRVVITTNTGSIAGFVNDDKGIVVAPNDPDALAKSICSLITNPQWCIALADQARRFMSIYPDREALAEHFVAILNWVHVNWIRIQLAQRIHRRLMMKQKWQLWKKGPIAAYREVHRKIAYHLVGLRGLRMVPEALCPTDLGVDEYGRSVACGLRYYGALLRKRGVDLSAIVVLGSRAKGRWTKKSDVDVVVIARNLPAGRMRNRILSEGRILMSIQPKGYSNEEFLKDLDNLSLIPLDAMYFGKPIYDDGFWTSVIKRFSMLQQKYDLQEPKFRESISLF